MSSEMLTGESKETNSRRRVPGDMEPDTSVHTAPEKRANRIPELSYHSAGCQNFTACPFASARATLSIVMADALALSPEQPEPPQKRRGQRKSGTWKLRGPALDTALQCLAEYQKLADIVSILKEKHDIDITVSAIGRMAHVSRWEEEIFRRRAVLDNKMLEVPISSRWWRQNERHGLFIRSKSSDKLSDTARKTLMDAAEEMGHLRRGETQSQPSIVVNVLAALQGSSPEALRIYAETGALPVAQAAALVPGIEGHPTGCRCAECPLAIAASAPATATASTPAIAVIPAAGERRAWPVQAAEKTAVGENRISEDALTAEAVAESTACAESPVMSIMSTSAAGAEAAAAHGPTCPCDVCGLWQSGAVRRRQGRPSRYVPGRRKRKRTRAT